MSLFATFPFGINPEMDRHAASYNLAHWSCVSPKSNEWWVRSDGRQADSFLSGSTTDYLKTLREIDRENPLPN